MNGRDETPASARRRIRLAVRRAREERSLTQATVADAMDWSLSKVMRIESGEVSITPNDLRPLLRYLGVTDKATIDDLVAAARAARQRKRWWDAPEYRDALSPALKQVVQYEPEATAFRYFVPLIFPGRMQTPAYARAVLDNFKDELSAKTLDALHAVRMRRRETFLADTNRAVAYTLLDESVYYRRIGGAAVLVEQLADTLRMIDQGRVVLRTIPLEGDMNVTLFGQFEIVYLSAEDEEHAIMYRESDRLDEIVENPVDLARHRETFERLWKSSYDEAASAEMIKRRIGALTSDPEKRTFSLAGPG